MKLEYWQKVKETLEGYVADFDNHRDRTLREGPARSAIRAALEEVEGVVEALEADPGAEDLAALKREHRGVLELDTD